MVGYDDLSSMSAEPYCLSANLPALPVHVCGALLPVCRSARATHLLSPTTCPAPVCHVCFSFMSDRRCSPSVRCDHRACPQPATCPISDASRRSCCDYSCCTLRQIATVFPLPQHSIVPMLACLPPPLGGRMLHQEVVLPISPLDAALPASAIKGSDAASDCSRHVQQPQANSAH